MVSRAGNNPKRRIAPINRLDQPGRVELSVNLKYLGSAFHKRHPGDYGFHPPANPRPWKSLCDGHRPILKAEAGRLFRSGILKGMFSDFLEGGRPKYVWSVDLNDDVYEAKTDSDGYHGYRLEDEDEMRKIVLAEWGRR